MVVWDSNHLHLNHLHSNHLRSNHLRSNQLHRRRLDLAVALGIGVRCLMIPTLRSSVDQAIVSVQVVHRTRLWFRLRHRPR